MKKFTICEDCQFSYSPSNVCPAQKYCPRNHWRVEAIKELKKMLESKETSYPYAWRGLAREFLEALGADVNTKQEELTKNE